MASRSTDANALSGRVALVTGASRGIGAAIAESLAKRGATVIVTGRDEQGLAATVRTIEEGGGRAVAKICDVANAGAVSAMFSELEGPFGELDILVNNAGVAGPTAKVDSLPIDVWREVIETNLNGTFLMTKAALPLMRRGGVIINNLSIAAKTAFPGMSAYVAAKHGVLGFTLALREELRERGIRVIALVPGATDTGIWQQFWPEAPRQKMMSPTDVAETLATAICLPENTSVDELVITPAAGTI